MEIVITVLTIFKSFVTFAFFPDWLFPVEEYDSSGIKDYIKECNRVGVIPISYFQRHIQDTRFVMRHHGLGPLGAKAISKPLEVG